VCTVRYASEFGYEVTMVKGATASYSDEHMHPRNQHSNYASSIVNAEEIVAVISALDEAKLGAAR
jgi:nicotinamidase-related amidase